MQGQVQGRLAGAPLWLRPGLPAQCPARKAGAVGGQGCGSSQEDRLPSDRQVSVRGCSNCRGILKTAHSERDVLYLIRSIAIKGPKLKHGTEPRKPAQVQASEAAFAPLEVPWVSLATPP